MEVQRKKWCVGCVPGYVLATYVQGTNYYCRDCIKKNPIAHTDCLECGTTVPFDPRMEMSFFQCPCHDLDVDSDYEEYVEDEQDLCTAEQDDTHEK